MPLLTPAEFEAVRQALDTSLDDETLPDATIALDIYQHVGEARVYALVPTADAIVDTNPRIRIAAIFYVAAELAPVIPHILREDYGQYSYQLDKKDWTKQAADLRRKADEQIAAVIGDPIETEDLMPAVFTLAHANRRRWAL